MMLLGVRAGCLCCGLPGPNGDCVGPFGLPGPAGVPLLGANGLPVGTPYGLRFCAVGAPCGAFCWFWSTRTPYGMFCGLFCVWYGSPDCCAFGAPCCGGVGMRVVSCWDVGAYAPYCGAKRYGSGLRVSSTEVESFFSPCSVVEPETGVSTEVGCSSAGAAEAVFESSVFAPMLASVWCSSEPAFWSGVPVGQLFLSSAIDSPYMSPHDCARAIYSCDSTQLSHVFLKFPECPLKTELFFRKRIFGIHETAFSATLAVCRPISPPSCSTISTCSWTGARVAWWARSTRPASPTCSSTTMTRTATNSAVRAPLPVCRMARFSTTTPASTVPRSAGFCACCCSIARLDSTICPSACPHCSASYGPPACAWLAWRTARRPRSSRCR